MGRLERIFASENLGKFKAETCLEKVGPSVAPGEGRVEVSGQTVPVRRN